MKLVINNCYGGFSLSEQGMLLLAEKKGQKIYSWKDPRFQSDIFTMWFTAPVPDGVDDLPEDFYNANHFYEKDLPRDDPMLVQVVEELGTAANGRCAGLKVVEIPDDVEWEIKEYDGNEWVAEKHKTWS